MDVVGYYCLLQKEHERDGLGVRAGHQSLADDEGRVVYPSRVICQGQVAGGELGNRVRH